MHAPPPPLPSSNGTTPVSYEHYLVHTAQDLVRQIARHYETLDANDVEPNARFNANRAWNALDDLGKIEL